MIGIKSGINSWFLGLWAAYLLAGAHYYTHTVGGDGLYRLYNAWGWIFASLMIGMGLWRLHRSGELVGSRLLAFIWVGALLTLIPFAYPGALFKIYAIPRELGLFGGLLFLFALYQFKATREERFDVLYLVLGAVLIEAAIAFSQFYFLTEDNWLGYDTKVNQPFGVFLQRNVLASFMATGLAIALWLMTEEERLSRLKGALCYTVLVSSTLLLVVGQSRAGQLGAAISLALLLPVLALRQRQRLTVALGLIALGLFLGWLSLPSTSRLADTLGLRGVMWTQTLRLIAASPWTGHGYAGFESAYIRAYADAKARDPSLPIVEENLDHPHNEIFYWAVEGGIVPVIGIAIAVVAFFVRLRGLPWHRSLPLLALVAPLVLHTQVEFPFDISMAHWLVFLLLVYVADHEAGAIPSRPFRASILAPLLAIGIPVVVVPFMLTTLQANYVLINFQRGGHRDVVSLLTVINPMSVLPMFEYEVYTLSLGSGKPRDLEAYVKWGRRMNDRMPRAIVYINMMLALHKLKRPLDAEQVRLEALHLYPHNPLLNGAIPLRLEWDAVAPAGSALKRPQ